MVLRVVDRAALRDVVLRFKVDSRHRKSRVVWTRLLDVLGTQEFDEIRVEIHLFGFIVFIQILLHQQSWRVVLHGLYAALFQRFSLFGLALRGGPLFLLQIKLIL